jgi:hypothetical protein
MQKYLSGYQRCNTGLKYIKKEGQNAPDHRKVIADLREKRPSRTEIDVENFRTDRSWFVNE